MSTINRIGSVGKNKHGSIMKVVVYNNSGDIWVQFNKGKPIHTTWTNFIKGEVKNPYDMTIHKVGFIGEGEYKVSVNKKNTPQYQVWNSMILRCYSEKSLNKHSSYKGCSVDPVWHNFQNFAEWYDQNYYEIEGEKMSLDKDILIKGNKIYSPNTSVFAPSTINNIFTKSDSKRGELPIGVRLDKEYNKYIASCKNGSKSDGYLGYYNTPEEAFLAYKTAKEKYIKETANKYKDKIPIKLYNALIEYVVEIND